VIRRLLLILVLTIFACSKNDGQENQVEAGQDSKSTTKDLTAIDVSLLDADGFIALLNQHHGKVLFINAWATWCVPCIYQVPELNAFWEIHRAAASLNHAIRTVYLENYDMTLALSLCAGVDLWINTPQKPFEASGTSGMKAALNGVPSLSILDGWWIEGHVEGVTGWSIDDAWQTESDSAKESERLHDKLEYLIVPMYYGRPIAYATVMRSAIALNGSFFNAQRMVDQYVQNAYLASVEGEPARHDS